MTYAHVRGLLPAPPVRAGWNNAGLVAQYRPPKRRVAQTVVGRTAVPDLPDFVHDDPSARLRVVTSHSDSPDVNHVESGRQRHTVVHTPGERLRVGSARKPLLYPPQPTVASLVSDCNKYGTVYVAQCIEMADILFPPDDTKRHTLAVDLVVRVDHCVQCLNEFDYQYPANKAPQRLYCSPACSKAAIRERQLARKAVAV